MKRIVNFWSLFGAISAVLFLLTEIVAVASAAIWSISGLLGLGKLPAIVLAVLIGAPSLYAAARVAILAFNAETDPVNN